MMEPVSFLSRYLIVGTLAADWVIGKWPDVLAYVSVLRYNHRFTRIRARTRRFFLLRSELPNAQQPSSRTIQKIAFLW
jgi:hypothetical protein